MTKNRNLKLIEVFCGLQGEGPYNGHPAVFIRLSGCVAPYCSFCDTSYSWNNPKIITLSVDNIITKIERFWKKKTSLIVITGGEPMAQPAVYELIKVLDKNGYTIQIETSGKVEIDWSIISQCNVTTVCSPKWDSANNNFAGNPDTINSCDYLKFVIDNDMDFKRAETFIKKNKIKKENVYLMPKTVDYSFRDEKIRQKVWQICVSNGYKYSPRLHAEIFGAKRGI